ncbi:MAG: PQQ-like beta-propeller repeat protein [Gemmataceae bacterium]|nr:PQQ-like beta-propeller repeat protein [Gemmataceae bacterium]
MRSLAVVLTGVALGALIGAFVADPVAADVKNGSDWPCFLGPLGTSVSPETGIVAPWPKAGPRVVWQRKIGIGYGAPVVSKGKLYLFHRKASLIPHALAVKGVGPAWAAPGVFPQAAFSTWLATLDPSLFDRFGTAATLTCMKADTGEPLWSFEYPTDYKDKYSYNGGPRCCPVVDGDLIFLHGVEGMLHCLNADTGKVVWKLDTVAKFGIIQNFFGVGSTPVVEGELLIVQIGGSPPGSANADFAELKGNGSAVVAFEKTTGKVRYQLGDELASYASPVIATIGGRRWAFVFARGGLVAFEPKSGKLDFHFPWRSKDYESVNASNPVVVGDTVLITETYGPGSALLKVKAGAKAGAADVLWNEAGKSRKSLQCHWMTPIHHDGYVYGSSGRHDYNAELRCVELATGKVMWREEGLTRTSLLMVDGHFVCLGEDGILRLLKVNPRKYEEISQVELIDPETQRPLLKYPCWAAPILSHGLMYLRGDDRLVCVELIPRK